MKEVAEAQKLIDIARSRRITMSEILQYDLITKIFFEGQPPSKPDKHKIVTKLEDILEIKNDFENLVILTSSWLLTLCFCYDIYR